MYKKFKIAWLTIIGTAAPVVLLLSVWQIAAMRSSSVNFFFSSPIDVITRFWFLVKSGKLIVDSGYTLFPLLTGLAIGVTFGTLLGFALHLSPRFAQAVGWNIVILGSVPIFAVAPMMIVWFGIGLRMKIAMAVLSTFFVAAAQAYRGGQAVPPELKAFFKLSGANDWITLRKLIFPNALDWVLASLHLNANLALLGVFIGEFIAAERGLARSMLNAGSLYDIGDVLAYALAMMIIVIGLELVIHWAERNRYRVIQWISVDRQAYSKRGDATLD